MGGTEPGLRRGSAAGRRGALAAVFLVALAARLTWIAIIPPRMTSDSLEYLTLGRNIREHAAFSLRPAAPHEPTTRRGPMYPLFVAILGDSTRVARTS